MVAAAVGGPFYVSIIYCLTVAGKHPFLSLHDAGRFSQIVLLYSFNLGLKTSMFEKNWRIVNPNFPPDTDNCHT